MTSNSLFVRRLIAVSMALMATAVMANEANEREVDLAIERQGAGAALVELGESAGIQVAVRSDVSRDIELGPIKGRFTVAEALESMLKDSGLVYRFGDGDSVAIGMARAAEGDGTAGGGGAASPASADTGDDEEEVETMIVTGSRIERKPGEIDRQVTVYDRVEIEASGVTTVEEFMRRLPQSFNAPTSNGAAFSGSFGSTSNYFAAAGVNLRGLGERATLILIDGKRTARGGVLGEATDINQIPLTMIERIEVIFDGASAIYGADAVGGVVNVITRKDYEGVDLGLVHSRPQAGGATESRVSFGGTHSWGDVRKGSVTLSYEYFTRDTLNGDDRDIQFATSTVVDEPAYGWPPNIQSGRVYDPVIRDFVQRPLFLLDANGNPVPVGDPSGVTEVYRTRMPDNADGELTLADFKGLQEEPGSRPEAGFGLIPGRDEHAVRLGFRQGLARDMVLSGSVFYGWGDTYALESNQNRFMVTEPLRQGWQGLTGTPHTPFQGPAQLWGEFDFLPDVERFTEKESVNASVALDGRINDAWEWELSASRATSQNHGLHLNEMSGSRLYCVGHPFAGQCEVDPRLATLNPFHLPYFGLSSEEEFIDVLVVPDARTINESTDMAYEFTVRGPLFQAPGGSAQSLFSVARRSEESYLFDETGTIEGDRNGAFPTLGVRLYDEEMSRESNSFSTELNVPLFGSVNARPGLQGFDVTVSARYDDVRSEGGIVIVEEFIPSPRQFVRLSETEFTLDDSVAAWSAGFVWRPVDWLKVRANINESYAAPPLTSYVKPQVRTLSTIMPRDSGFMPYLDENGNPISIDIISVYGGNPELEQERNTTRSFGFDLAPQAIPNLVVRVNFHWNELIDRIGNLQPATGIHPDDYAIQPHITVDEATGRLVRPNSGYRFNLGRVQTNGIDVDLTYYVETPLGDLDARINYGYLDESLWRHIDDCGSGGDFCHYPAYGESVDVVERLPILSLGPNFNIASPFAVAPRHRVDFRFGWSRGGWRVDLSSSHQSRTITEVSRYNRETQERILGTNTVTAANPVDLVIRYDFEKVARKPRIFNNTRIQLSVPNVLDDNATFDLQPRFGTDPGGVFDAIASRPRGRAFTLTFDKTFTR